MACLGYIGGSVLSHLLNHPEAPSFNITALVRSSDRAEKFKSIFGINTVIGSHSDSPLMEKLASEADVVFAMV